MTTLTSRATLAQSGKTRRVRHRPCTLFATLRSPRAKDKRQLILTLDLDRDLDPLSTLPRPPSVHSRLTFNAPAPHCRHAPQSTAVSPAGNTPPTETDFIGTPSACPTSALRRAEKADPCSSKASALPAVLGKEEGALPSPVSKTLSGGSTRGCRGGGALSHAKQRSMWEEVLGADEREKTYCL